MGGVPTLDLVTSRPDLVRAIVLVEPPLHFKKHPSMKMMRELIGAQLLRRRQGDVAAAERFMRWATTMDDGTNGYDLTPPEAQEKLRANSAAIMRELDSGTGEHVKSSAIAEIRVPAVLLLGGATLPEYGRAAQRIKKALPALEIVTVPGAGHVLPVSHPQAVVDAVARVSRDPALTA
jgi:pimeloyl-ACP methyl ester carboxylesterase